MAVGSCRDMRSAVARSPRERGEALLLGGCGRFLARHSVSVNPLVLRLAARRQSLSLQGCIGVHRIPVRGLGQATDGGELGVSIGSGSSWPGPRGSRSHRRPSCCARPPSTLSAPTRTISESPAGPSWSSPSCQTRGAITPNAGHWRTGLRCHSDSTPSPDPDSRA
jgi:hypothetical protein